MLMTLFKPDLRQNVSANGRLLPEKKGITGELCCTSEKRRLRSLLKAMPGQPFHLCGQRFEVNMRGNHTMSRCVCLILLRPEAALRTAGIPLHLLAIQFIFKARLADNQRL
jgi:hypothetical protein